MAYRAKRIIRRTSLYPNDKSVSGGGTSKVGFIDETPTQKRESLSSLQERSTMGSISSGLIKNYPQYRIEYQFIISFICRLEIHIYV